MTTDPVQRWWQLCQQAFASGDWPMADGALRRMLSLKPEAPELLDLLAYTLLMQGNFPACETVLRLALARGSQSFWTPHKLGDALRGQQRLEEAVEAYEQALAWGSDSPLTARNLLQVLDGLEPGRALTRLEQWVAPQPLAWNDRPPWLVGACDAALASPGLEIAGWLQQRGCPDPEIRRLGLEEAILKLDFSEALELANPALRQRLERMLRR